MIEREGFRTFVKNNISQYDMPCRATIKSYLKEKYEKTSSKYKEIIKKADNVTLTTDIWTDTMNTTSFLGVTVHFEHDSALFSANLGVHEMSQYCIGSSFVRWQRMSSVVLCTYPESGRHQFDQSRRRAG